MLVRYGYEIGITCEAPTPLICLLSVHPDLMRDLRAPESFFTTPTVTSSTHIDLHGNRARRLVAPAGAFSLWGDATVSVDGLFDVAYPAAREVAVPDLPSETLVYLQGSRYCETDLLSQTAWDMFGHLAPGWSRVQAICDFVHQHVRFDYGEARATRTASETFEEGVGVCRDFAHLAVALCRALNIPTRYVNGHISDIGLPPVLDPMDFSAWIEVYLDQGWCTFDPRNNSPRIGRIVVSRGRDAADVALISSFGPHELTNFRVWTYELGEPALQVTAGAVVRGEVERASKGISCAVRVAQTRQELAAGDVPRRVTLQPAQGLDLHQRRRRPVDLCDGHGTVQRHDRAGVELGQVVVQRQDLWPVGVLDPHRVGVHRADGRLHLVRAGPVAAQARPDQRLSLLDQPR